MQSDIENMIKFYSIYTFPLGTRRLKYINSTIRTIGPFYKFYIVIILAFVCIVYPPISYINYLTMKDTFRFDASLVVISVITHSFLFVSFLVVMILSLLDGKVSKTMYESLMKVDSCSRKNFNYPNINCKIALFHAFFVCTCIMQTIMNIIAWPEYIGWPFHILIMIIDTELLRFVFEIELISKRFDTNNQIMKNINAHNKNIDFDLKAGLLQSVLRKDSKKSLKPEKNLNILLIHNKLLDIVENLNRCYSWKVFK